MAYLYIGNQKVTPILAGGESYRVVTLTETDIDITLYPYTIYEATSNSLNSLTLTLSEDIDDEFIAQVNFTSGYPKTDIILNSDIEWIGDNVSETQGFVPRANCNYSIIFYYTGTVVRGVIQGTNIES